MTAHRLRHLVLVDSKGNYLCATPIAAPNGGDPLVESRQELFSVFLEHTGMKIIEVNRIVKGRLND